MLKSVIGRVRLIGMMEAVSYLILLGFAMPMKHIWHNEIYVKYFGWTHGVLFILYCLSLLQGLLGKFLSFKHCVILFIAALVPFGPFVADRSLKELER
jgi:integral membrane protein